MDDNQNTNQTVDQNTSDGGGIFGSFMNTNTQTVSDTDSQTSNTLQDGAVPASTRVTPSDSVFDSIMVASSAVDTPPTQTSTQVMPDTEPAQGTSIFTNAQKSTTPKISTENPDDVKELESLGVTVVDETRKPRNTTVFDSNSQFKKTKTPASSVVTQPTSVPVDTKALEEDFSNTFSGSSLMDTKSSTVDALDQEEQKLKKLHAELKARAEQKKQKVKEGLEKLKKEKELLGKELQEIKEIEDIASKIAEKIQNLEQIDTELDDIEKRAREELS